MRLNFRNTGTNGAESITDYTRKYSVYEINDEKKQPAAEKNISLYNKMSSEKL